VRAVILILILLVVAAIAAIATGFLDISQTRSAQVPQVRATDNGIQAQGGQAPAFDVDTGKIELGTREATVPLPDIRVAPPAGEAQANRAAPQPAPSAPQTQPSPQPQGVPTTDATQR
jgi:hypothetical protein